MFDLPDTEWYLAIAEGKTALVLQPFSSRQLGPLIARAIHQMFAISIEHAFVIEALFASVALISIVGWLLIQAGVRPLALTAVAGLAFWPILFNGFVFPDLLFAALLSAFLLLLERKQYLACGFMLFPLWLTREVAILVLVCFFAACWRRLRPIHYGTAIAASFAGAKIVKMLVAGGPGNQEGLGYFVYMAGKVPWNLLRNGFGVLPWMNLKTDYCTVPAWKIDMHLGRISSVGVCGWDPIYPLWTLRIALASFGLLPVLFVFVLKKKKTLWPDSPMLRFCIIYGTLSLVLAPMIGVTVVRYFGYAWPLFILALPMMSMTVQTLKRSAAWWFLPAHFAVAWTLVPNHTDRYPLQVEIGLFVAICGLYLITWTVVARSGAVCPANDGNPA